MYDATQTNKTVVSVETPAVGTLRTTDITMKPQATILVAKRKETGSKNRARLLNQIISPNNNGGPGPTV